METENVEEKARKMGWVPQEEWKGDEQKWRPADEFVERGENIVPILKDRIEKLESDFTLTVKAQKREIERVKKEAQAKAEADYNAKLAELDKREVEAVGANDTAEYLAVKQERQKLKPPEIPTEVKPTPVFEDWNKKNEWYAAPDNITDKADTDMTIFANAVGAEIRAESPNITEEKFLERVEARVRKSFPYKFENQNRENDSIADSSTHTAQTGGKKTWADIPAEGKKAFKRAAERVKNAGGTLTKEDYIKDYFEG